MQRLKSRPREGCEQEVMQEEGGANAQPDCIEKRQPAVQQKDQVEQEEGQGELDQDLSRNVPEQDPAQKKSLRVCMFLKERSALTRSLREQQIRQQGDAQKDGGDSTADVSDVGQNFCMLLVHDALSGQILCGDSRRKRRNIK